MRLFILVLCLFSAQIADAQVGLPSVRVPLPGAGLPSLPTATLPRESDLDPEFRGTDLRNLRALQISTLLRTHRDVIEADPHGNPIVRGEVLVVAPSAAALQAAAAAGFSVVRESTLDALELRVVVLRVSSGTARSLARLQALDPNGIYDFNHIYIESGTSITADVFAPQTPHVDEEAGAVAVASTTRIGLIDGGIDPAHEVFSGLTLHQHGCSGRVVPYEHGTAVASLMVGRAPSFHGAAPGSELYAADVYCGLPTGGAADVVAESFSWLVKEKVPVINVSLVGPPNRVLEGVVQRVIAGGHIVVAAVGNDGPAAAPLYPAAWPGVVGVTGVDARRRVLVEAERGAQVKFAAPGAQMAAPNHGRATPWCAEPLLPRLLWRGFWHSTSQLPTRLLRIAPSWHWRKRPWILGLPERIPSMGLVWWARRSGVSPCSRGSGQTKLRKKSRSATEDPSPPTRSTP